jgi:N6-adenosine-specific RNA methylase IME4
MSALVAAFTHWAQVNRPQGGCRGVLIDCPWTFDNYSAKGELKNPKAHYPCVTMEELERLPVAMIAASNAAVWSWATSPLLDQQIACLKKWGCRYVACEAWAKGSKNSTGEPGDNSWKGGFGPGYVRRICAEFVLIGAFGRPDWLPGCRSLRNAFFDAQREHSRKPDSQYARVEASVIGPYCEIFSRSNRADWIHFGNETGKFGEAT